MDEKEVGEFIYKEKVIDPFGHIRYICECHICGQRIEYGKITYKKPVCYECKYKLGYKTAKKRRYENKKVIDQIMARVRVVVSNNRNCLHVCEENGALCHRYNMKCADAIIHWIMNGDKEDG